MTSPAVAIVVPAHNDEAWIVAALESCLRQTMAEIEVICVDDSSTDNTRVVVNEMRARDSRVRLVELDENVSAFQARRIGVEKATAPYVLFLDADDELAPDAVQVAFELAREAEADVVAFGVDFVMPEGKRQPAFAAQLQPKHGELLGAEILPSLFPVGQPAHGHVWGYLFASALIKNAYSGLPDDIFLPRANDLPISFLVMAAASKYVSTPSRGYRYFFRRGTSGHKVADIDQFMFYLGAVNSIELIEGKLREMAASSDDDGAVIAAYESTRLFIIGNILKYCLGVSDAELRITCFARLRDRVDDVDIIRAAGNFVPDAKKLFMEAGVSSAPRHESVNSVLITTLQLGIGGIQGVIAEQARCLLEAGMKVTIAVQRSVESVYELPAGIEVVYITGATMADRINSWLDICRESDADVVLDHYVLYNQNWPLYALAAYTLGIPTVGFIQSFALRPISDDKTTTSFLDLYLPLLESVVTLSAVDVAYWKMRGIERVVYLPHPPSPMLAQLPQREGPKAPPTGRVKVVWWGRLQQSTKQVLDLVPIIAALRERGVDAELSIIGPETVEVTTARLLADAQSHGMTDFVKLRGALHGDALVEELVDAHINIFTSVIEGSPLALVEAQALGLPVVMYELPWLATLDGNEGIIAVDQRDVHGMARQIALLVNDPDKYVAASAGSLAAAESATSFDFPQLYTQLLTGTLPGEFSPEPTVAHARLLLDWVVRYAEKNSRHHAQVSADFDRFRKGHAKLRKETAALRKQVSSLRESLKTARAKFASQKTRIIELRRQLESQGSRGAGRILKRVKNLLKRVVRKARSVTGNRLEGPVAATEKARPAANQVPSTPKALVTRAPGREVPGASVERPHSRGAMTQDDFASIAPDKPDVTVVIPVYNAEPWLDQCLSSVLSQTGVVLEVICVNDGSTDQSGVILERFAAQDPRVRVIEQKNSGQSVGRNAGVDLANGRYVIFLDSDDYWMADVLSELVRRADESALDVLFLEGGSVRDEGVSDQLWARYGDYYGRKKEYRDTRPGSQMIVDMRRGGDYKAHVGLYLSRTAFVRRAGVRFIPGIVHQDNPYTFTLLMNADRVAHADVMLYARRLRPGSTITTLKAYSSVKGYYLGYISMLREVSSRNVSPDHAGVLSLIVYEIFMSAYERFAQLPSSYVGQLKKLDLSTEGQVAFRLLGKLREAQSLAGESPVGVEGVAVPVAREEPGAPSSS